MNWNRAIRLGLSITAALSVAGTARAQGASDAHIHELVQQATARLAAVQAEGQAAAAPAQAPAGATRPTVSLTLDDVVKAALDHNLNISVQRLNPEINDISYSSLRAVYRPSLTSTLATQSQTNVSTTTIAGGSTAGAGIDTGLTTFNGGLTQSVPWGGGSFAVTLNNNRQTTASLNTLFNPTFNSNWSFQYTQPLLRGLRTDSTRQGLSVTKVNRDISDVQLQATITNTLSNVREAYWNYVYAVQSVDVARQSLALAQQLVANNQVKVQVGTMAPLDVIQAQSQAATAQVALVLAQATMRTDELALKQLIVSGTEDPLWNSTIDPVNRPEFQPEAIDVEAAVKRAIDSRTDLQIAKKNLESNTDTVKYLRDQLLPQADLVANYGLVGLGGTQLITGRHRRQPHRDRLHSRRLRGCAVDAVPYELSTLVAQRELQLSPGSELGRGGRGPRAGAAEPERGADQADRAADCHRCDQRSEHRTEQHRARAGGAGRAPARPAAARCREQQVRGRHVHELLRGAGAAGPGDGPEQRAAGHPRLSQFSRRIRAPAADDAAESRRHCDQQRHAVTPDTSTTVGEP